MVFRRSALISALIYIKTFTIGVRNISNAHFRRKWSDLAVFQLAICKFWLKTRWVCLQGQFVTKICTSQSILLSIYLPQSKHPVLHQAICFLVAKFQYKCEFNICYQKFNFNDVISLQIMFNISDDIFEHHQATYIHNISCFTYSIIFSL